MEAPRSPVSARDQMSRSRPLSSRWSAELPIPSSFRFPRSVRPLWGVPCEPACDPRIPSVLRSSLRLVPLASREEPSPWPEPPAAPLRSARESERFESRDDESLERPEPDIAELRERSELELPDADIPELRERSELESPDADMPDERELFEEPEPRWLPDTLEPCVEPDELEPPYPRAPELPDDPLREPPWPEPLEALRSPPCEAPDPDIPWLREFSGEPCDEFLLPLFLSFAISSSCVECPPCRDRTIDAAGNA